MTAIPVMTANFGSWAVITAFAVILFGGFTKGAVGFGLPMIAISGIGSVMPAEVAVAALILPGLVTNAWQSLRNGVVEAVASLRKFWRLNAVLLVMIYVCAQLVVVIPENALFIILGAGITLFTTLQVIGFRPTTPRRLTALVETGVGLLSGFFGGLSGVWGPPILMYLISIETPKVEQVRVQGLSFLIGAAVLTVAHLRSGLLGAVNLPFSAILVIPAVAGMAIGLYYHDRMDQVLFRKATLIVLAFAGLNLLRRGFIG
ncbi:MAG: sulfite exporter TauE/SafE family protein [Paracoccaceae bacterium]